jgi:hypothetical protein
VSFVTSVTGRYPVLSVPGGLVVSARNAISVRERGADEDRAFAKEIRSDEELHWLARYRLAVSGSQLNRNGYHSITSDHCLLKDGGDRRGVARLVGERRACADDEAQRDHRQCHREDESD